MVYSSKSFRSYMIYVLYLGGTADITVHQRRFNGTIHEVIPPDGGPFGGKLIDDAFYIFCPKYVVEMLWKNWKQQNLKIIWTCFVNLKRRKDQ